jgi:diguanylate cyclase (GGDEF)-like protein/putative nucleotidyltransferase with HDIG domain
MKSFVEKGIAWWFATMVPAHTSMTMLIEREYERKRRLLATLLLFGLSITLITTLPATFTVDALQITPGWVVFFVGLGALWLNRQGYLKLASVTMFVSNGLTLFLSAHLLSLHDPIALLWTLSLLPLLLTIAGLFLPAWNILLMAVVETLLLFEYFLVQRHDLLSHLLTSQELWSFLIYFCALVACSAMIGIFYTVTTQKALIQADRAAELEQAHEALTEAYTNLEQAHATIQKQALSDGLTGLPNHRAMMDQLEKELERVRRFDRPLSLLFFDVDRFKRINDTHGHAVGDTVLRQIGERAIRVLRGGDTVGRFGGEEFVLLLPETDADGAKTVAERLRTAIASEPIAADMVTGGLVATVSIGVATYPADGCSEQELLGQADRAMYLAKRLGRNQVRTAREARQLSPDLELMTLLQQEGDYEAAERKETTLEGLRETYTVGMIYSLMSLLERRDQGMSQHAFAVSDLATAIAQAMHLEPAQVSRIGMAALLHDIGKVAIPDVLLQKAGRLSMHERTLLREHAELGAQILEASPFLQDLTPAVRHHHEWWDGGGYPDQLAGEAIPLAARIIAVAEAYDAMQRNRPYRAGCTSEEAANELQRCAGTQFDPAVVRSLLALLTNQREQELSLQTIG